MRGIVVLLMNREREHRMILGKDSRGSIALVDVRINNHCLANRPIGLHSSDRHRHVMNSAESLAMAGIGVMKATAKIAPKPILQRRLCRQNRPSGSQPEGLAHF